MIEANNIPVASLHDVCIKLDNSGCLDLSLLEFPTADEATVQLFSGLSMRQDKH